MTVPAPLAVDAATAERHAGPCALCSYAMLRGERYAQLTVSGRLAHLPCIAREARTTSRRAA